MTETPTRCGFVTLLGPSNAGKSTITNHFVGAKVSIVTPKVQTTRNLIKGIGIRNNTQIVFIDTPGIFKPKRRLDRAMVASAWSGVDDADILVLVVDAKKGLDKDTKAIIEKLIKSKKEAVLLINKIDLVSKDKLLELIAKLNEQFSFKETFLVSALTGKYLDEFYDYLAQNLPENPWFYPEDQMSDMPLQMMVAEIVREKIFFHLRQELPYAVTVEPQNWLRKEDGSIKADMNIYVQKDNQKSILLGHNGSMIKKIGQAARFEIEKELDEKVHLFLFVKVRENWADDPNRYKIFNLDFNV